MAALLTIIALLMVGSGAGSGFLGYLPIGFAAPRQASDTLFAEEYSLGSFDHATRVCVGSQGWIYVVDGQKNAVSLFKAHTALPVTVGGYGWTSTTFDRPTSLSTDGLNVYVADYGNHRVQRFDRNLNFISSFSTRDTEFVAARFGYPAGAALSRLGDLFILDGENIRVTKFSSQSRFERSFGNIEDKRGKLLHPIKILVAPNDHVFVLEPERLIEYDYFGNYLRAMGEGIFLNAQGFDVTSRGVCVGTDSTLYWFSSGGELESETPLTGIIASSPVLPLRDVAVTKNRLYILTTHTIIVLKIVGANDE